MTKKNNNNSVIERSRNDASIVSVGESIECIFSTGERGLTYIDGIGYAYEELEISEEAIQSARLDKGISILDNHNRYEGVDSILGITEGWRIDDGKLVGGLKFSTRSRGQEIKQDVEDKILKQFSLGYKVHRYEKVGEITDIPILRAVNWTPTELSIVPVSFESQNGIRADFDPSNIGNLMSKNNNKSDEPNATSVTPEATNDRGLLVTMQDRARKMGLDDDFAIRAYADNLDLGKFNERVLDELEKRDNNKHVASPVLASDNRLDSAESTRADIETSILHRIAPDQFKLTDGARNFSGLSLVELGRDMLQEQNIATRGMSKMQLAERALGTTSDLPLIFSNVVNKTLRNTYQQVPKTYESLGRKVQVSDFRPVHRLALSEAPDLTKLNEHGEFQRSSIGESGESYKIATYGRIIGFTRQAFINDSLDALGRIPMMFGGALARSKNKFFWSLITGYDFTKGKVAPVKMADGKDVFHADHKNLVTGAAFSVEGMSKLRQNGRKQRTLKGELLNVAYQTLALPSTLETDADILLATLIAATQKDHVNPFNGKFSYIIEPLLDQISETDWYAFANPNIFDTFEHATLQGEDELNIETRNGFDTDGMEFRARADYGGGWIDSVGAALAKA